MDNPKFYEDFDWSQLETQALKPKIEKIFEIIPSDVKTIIDIGCGNGHITNALSKKFDITGVDRSQNALRHVESKKIKASCDQVPVEDKSFDLVFSSELIEHLEDDVFYKTIEEFKRISKKYIFLSIPNRENVKKNLIQCPECHYIYNRSYHLRGFTLAKIKKYFEEYEILYVCETGSLIRHYNQFLSMIKTKITPPNSWIPYYVMPKEKRKTFCPKCEHKFDYPYRFNLFSFAIDMLNILLSPKRPYWLMIFLQKKS